eukprot:3352411-Alexandrium_andersonii.AAC.1
MRYIACKPSPCLGALSPDSTSHVWCSGRLSAYSGEGWVAGSVGGQDRTEGASGGLCREAPDS